MPSEHIGLGTYGRVFKRPNDNYVIKIFGEDYGYLAYLKYVLRNQSNPHVPKIRGKLIHPFKEKSLYVVRIEVLNDAETSEQRQLLRILKTWSFGNMHMGILEDKLGDSWPDLIDTMYDIRNISKTNKPKVHIDIGDGNVMFRGASPVPVITDPLWFDND